MEILPPIDSKPLFILPPIDLALKNSKITNNSHVVLTGGNNTNYKPRLCF